MRYSRRILAIAIGVCAVLLNLPGMLREAQARAPVESLEAPGVSPARLNVALLKSEYTSEYFAEKWQYEGVIYKWLMILAENGIEHTLVSDRQLEQGELDEFTVLILPSALCLSDEERFSVREFLADGKGVIVSWAVGVRSDNGEWTGWDFLEGLTGSRFAGYIKGRPAIWVTFSGKSLLSAGLDAGHRLELLGGWKVALSGTEVDGYWSDYNLKPWAPDEKTGANAAAVIHNHTGNGRVAWLGFNASEVVARRISQTALTTLVSNAINWTGRIPVSRVWYWPDYYQAAAVLSQDVEYLFHNAEASVRVLREEGVSGTFFCVSDLALGNSELVKAFGEVGEVGSHSDDHSQFKGQPFDKQYSRLEKSVNALTEMGAKTIMGMRPPYELCDEATLKAWAMLGGEYVFGQPEYNPSMMPHLYTVPRDPLGGLDDDRTLVLLPRVVRDDHATMVVEALGDNDAIFEAHRMDMERIYSLSGLCMFGYHSNLVCLPDRVEILSRLARYAKSLDMWLTTAGDIARWWRMKSNVSASVRLAEEDRIALSVANRGEEAAEDLSVVIYLPRAGDEVRITCASSDVWGPRYTLEGDELVVHFDAIEADTLKTYTIEIMHNL